MAQLCDLPIELLLMIGDRLASSRDASSLTQVNRLFYQLFLSILLNNWFPEPSQRENRHGITSRPLKLFYHAAQHDSVNIIRYLIFDNNGLDLKGLESETTSSRLNILQSELSFLNFALLSDAPRVAADLMRHGACMEQVVEAFPDLTPLSLTLGQTQTSSQRDLDVALRIASRYVLPRTIRSLLSRGADPNDLGDDGLAPLHILATTRSRTPWTQFRMVHGDFRPRYPWMSGEEASRTFMSMFTQAVSELFMFGAQVHLPTSTTTNHECTHLCWCSTDCNHGGQTPLHLACNRLNKELVDLLLEKYGADPSLVNDAGYTPLYYALVHSRHDIAQILLDRNPKIPNPIVHTPQSSTALHIASRYSFSYMVQSLLERGADPNVLDVDGKTPLHEALSQTQANCEGILLNTFRHLENFGADPWIASPFPETPWEMIRTHPLKRVRDMVCLD